MKEGKERARGGKDGHNMVQIVAEEMNVSYLIQFPVLQYQGQIFNGQDAQVTRDAEGHLGQHGVDIGMPKDEPSPEGLTDINAQHGNGARVTDEAYDHG